MIVLAGIVTGLMDTSFKQTMTLEGPDLSSI